MEQLFFRNTNEAEVIETIKTSDWFPADLGRLECKKNFIYKNEWNRKYYETKQVKPIFVEEEEEIVVITVYTYFF